MHEIGRFELLTLAPRRPGAGAASCRRPVDMTDRISVKKTLTTIVASLVMLAVGATGAQAAEGVLRNSQYSNASAYYQTGPGSTTTYTVAKGKTSYHRVARFKIPCSGTVRYTMRDGRWNYIGTTIKANTWYDIAWFNTWGSTIEVQVRC